MMPHCLLTHLWHAHRVLLLRWRTLAWLSLIGFLCAQPSKGLANSEKATQFQAFDRIYQTIRQDIENKLAGHLHQAEIEINQVSQRLQLAPCQSDITIKDRRPEKMAGRKTYEVRCQSPNWQFYVTAQISGKLPVVKTTRAILKQAVIDASDVTLDYVPYNRVRRNTIVKLDTVIGMRAKRAIGPNETLNARQLQPPYLVFEDQPVNLITRIGNIQVESAGLALDNATLHQQVKVRNLSSESIVKGVVIGPNQVEVP